MEDFLTVWSMQPKEVIDEISHHGVYICDPHKIERDFGSENDSFKPAYDWLVHKMEMMIGNKPENVQYPVWAWYASDWKNKRPDLRKNHYALPGTTMYCIECNIPVRDVVLHDYSEWHCVLNKFPSLLANSEEEYDKLYDEYQAMSQAEQNNLMVKSWENIFNITPFQNNFRENGRFVQATFWELRDEYIQSIKRFKAR